MKNQRKRENSVSLVIDSRCSPIFTLSAQLFRKFTGKKNIPNSINFAG